MTIPNPARNHLHLVLSV